MRTASTKSQYKQSASLRQTVKSRQKPKEKKEPPSQSIIAFHSNPTDASTLLELLTDVFSKSEPSVQAAEYGIAAHRIPRHLAKGAPKLRD